MLKVWRQLKNWVDDKISLLLYETRTERILGLKHLPRGFSICLNDVFNCSDTLRSYTRLLSKTVWVSPEDFVYVWNGRQDTHRLASIDFLYRVGVPSASMPGLIHQLSKYYLGVGPTGTIRFRRKRILFARKVVYEFKPQNKRSYLEGVRNDQ